MPQPIKETIDLAYLDRFDADSGSLEVKLSKTGLTLIGVTADRLPNMRVALYASRSGKRYIVAVAKDDAQGYPLKEGKRGLRCTCARFVRALEARGVEVPQTVDLAWDAHIQAFVARLRLASGVRETDAATQQPGLLEAT